MAEEITRIYGYFRLPSVLPTSVLEDTQSEKILETEKRLKHKLLHLSFTEIYNSSLVSEKLFKKTKLDINPALKLENPLSSDQEYLRRSLVPSILENIKGNQAHQKEPISIFELSNIYLPRGKRDLPEEASVLVMATDQKTFREHKGFVESLLQDLNIKDLKFKHFHEESLTWDISSSAHVYSGSEYLGVIGKPTPQVLSNFQLTAPIFVTNLSVSTISKLESLIHFGQPLPKYPPVIEVITISSNMKIGKLIEKIKKTSPLITKVIYQESYNNKHTFKLHFSHPKKSLTQAKVNQIKGKILKVS